MLGHFLVDLAIVLSVAAVTSLVFQRLRQPPVLGYVIAGLIIGPYVPVPLVADVRLVGTLSELGVILLLFGIGLEFNIRKIARIGLAGFLTASIEVGFMISAGYLVANALGWTTTEALFAGACLGISSTMLVAKSFEAMGLRGADTELPFAVLVFEDLIAILLLAVLTGVASGSGLDTRDLVITLGKLIGFLLALLAAGLLVVPRLIRAIAGTGRAETLLIAAVGICFGMAVLAEHAGYSVALGAFLAGMLVSESGKASQVEHLVLPLRDLFAAIFFVSIGMTIDPALIAEHWFPALLLTAVVLLGKPFAVTVGAFLSGNGLPRSVRAGMSLGQIGELSFIFAALGIKAGVVGEFLLPVAVAVSCVTAATTPPMIKSGDRVVAALDRRMPRALQTFVAFYSSWVDGLRQVSRRESLGARLRNKIILLLLEAAMLGGVLVGGATQHDRLVGRLGQAGLDDGVASSLVVGVVAVLSMLFIVEVVRRARKLAGVLATEVVPLARAGEADLGRAPRRALIMTLELLVVLAVGLPLAAVVQPFVGLSVPVLAAVVAGIGLFTWRAVANLQGHVRAGSELIVEVLARQRRAPTEPDHHAAAAVGPAPAVQPPDELAPVAALLPGIPGLSPVRLDPGSRALGRSLAELNIRAQTGATVLAIVRGSDGVVLPTATERLRAGDILALAGAEDAVAAARELLEHAAPVGDPADM